MIIKKWGIKSIRHHKNMGQGAALTTGMKYAQNNSYEYVVHFDADGQHQSKDIVRILTPLLQNTSDVVLGSRFLNTELSKGIPKKRKILLRWAKWIDFSFSGVKLTDVHNGFRGLNKKAFSNILLHSSRMAHASEIIWEIKRLNLRIKEVSVEIRYLPNAHRKGQSVFNSINILIELCYLKAKRAWSKP